MKILENVKKVPGGLMVVPLFLGTILNTFFPNFLKLGGLHSAVFSNSGASTAMAIFFVCVGTQIQFKQAPEAIKRGGVLVVTKYAAGVILGYIVGKVAGPAGILGISSLAIISSVTNGNGGMFTALMGQYGDNVDIASEAVETINDGPFLTLLAMGFTGMADIPLISLFGAVSPMLVGCILGNLDNDIKEFLEPGVSLMIPFFSLCLGAGINLFNVVSAGFSGILLGFVVLVVSGVPLILADRYINKRPGYAGAALSTCAGNAVATPAAVALVAPEYAPFVPMATTQIAAAVIITVIFTPLLTAWVAKKYGSAKDLKKAN